MRPKLWKSHIVHSAEGTQNPGTHTRKARVLVTHSTTNAADDRIQDMGNNLDEWFIMALIPAKALIDQLSP